MGIQNISFQRSVASASPVANSQISQKDYYTKILQEAKPHMQANQGDLMVYKNPRTNELTVSRKGMLGDYGTIFKEDGSVIKVLAPANGGPKQVLPPGSIDSSILQDVISKKI